MGRQLTTAKSSSLGDGQHYVKALALPFISHGTLSMRPAFFEFSNSFSMNSGSTLALEVTWKDHEMMWEKVENQTRIQKPHSNFLERKKENIAKVKERWGC